MKFDGLLLSKKYLPSAKTLYTQDLSTLLSTTCLPNSLCYFWNHKWFFTTQLLYIFLAQAVHTFNKSSSSKWKLSRESAELRVLRTHMPTCLACLRANVLYVLTCSRDNVSCMLTCSRALRANLSTCLAHLNAQMPARLCAYVLTC